MEPLTGKMGWTQVDKVFVPWGPDSLLKLVCPPLGRRLSWTRRPLDTCGK